jgi:osmotically-inducible protein OsmY
LICGRDHEEETMRVKNWSAATAVMLISVTMTAAARPLSPATKADPKDLIPQIRKELMRLPYYGVFDFLVFSVNGPTVTVAGDVYNASIKKDAEREIKRIPGVENVVNNIEILPTSPFDDDIRWATYRAIYRDSALSRYLPGGGWVPHGRMWRFDRPFDGFGMGRRFTGQEPLGTYPIHIIVKGGHVTLEGVVDSEMDKSLAEMRTRGVAGSFSVENELSVD